MAIFDSLKNVVNNVINQTKNNSNDQSKFCIKCGAKLPADGKFCSECGAVVNNTTSTKERKQEYVGTVYKCSNCGCVITKTMAICPECGWKVTGQTAVSSVQEFKEQLMAIELNRKKGFDIERLLFKSDAPASPTDLQKLSLIRNFPIPNAIDDILEFMLLAVANIDVRLSKNTWRNNRTPRTMETMATIGRTISNAWVSKMQQAYQKAQITFPKDPIFQNIKSLYVSKMKELGVKV